MSVAYLNRAATIDRFLHLLIYLLKFVQKFVILFWVFFFSKENTLRSSGLESTWKGIHNQYIVHRCDIYEWKRI